MKIAMALGKTIILVGAAVVLASCGSALQSYKKGDYLTASEKAVNKLQSKPNDADARYVLEHAYPLLQDKALREIDSLDANLSIRNNEKVIDLYERLNKLSIQITYCPAAHEIVPQPGAYNDVLQDRKNATADYFYGEGMHALDAGTLEQARKALDDFKEAAKYVPDYKDVEDKIAEAREAATMHVVVEEPLFTFRLRPGDDMRYRWLMDEINRSYYRYPVHFYSMYDVAITPQQRVVLDFQDFVIGNAVTTTRTETLTREVVVGSTVIDGKTEYIYETVSARITIYRMQVIAEGLLDVRITDYRTGRYLNQRTLRRNAVWFTEWATFTGDRRALSGNAAVLAGRGPEIAPHSDILYSQVVNQLYDDAARYIESVYR